MSALVPTRALLIHVAALSRIEVTYNPETPNQVGKETVR
jgi:hypothetical protein